jgi:hypothetical protein
LQGSVGTIRDTVGRARRDLKDSKYNRIDDHYRVQQIALKTTEMATSDLEKYYKVFCAWGDLFQISTIPFWNASPMWVGGWMGGWVPRCVTFAPSAIGLQQGASRACRLLKCFLQRHGACVGASNASDCTRRNEPRMAVCRETRGFVRSVYVSKSTAVCALGPRTVEPTLDVV